ncbi:MAG TPA: adenosylcobalamin-dependent ribonucleoside-diphosphate reductase [Pseudomonadales bacterium]
MSEARVSEPAARRPAREAAVAAGLQPASLDIWDRKYRLRSATGEVVDRHPHDTLARVARALADVEAGAAARERWFDEFLWALEHGALPAGRIIANAGAEAHKPATSTINCTVSGTIDDSMDDILRKLHEAGLTLKAGCGIGYEFSTLRPRGAWVRGAGAQTSGPLSFMDVYDRMCRTVASAGGRRGAQMATFDIGHPDVLSFIEAKREDGRLRQFNLSLLVTDEFMQALDAGADWALAFPLTAAEAAAEGIDPNDPAQVVWRRWPVVDGYLQRPDGRVACRVYQRVPAADLWRAIMTAAYEFAEPGIILIDRVNDWNNNWFCEDIRATNPCGEQPLPPYGACLLGSIDVARFVRRPFSEQAAFDWPGFRRVVGVFTRMLDNVVEINGLPLGPQREELLRKRRHGMGFLGLGSALTLLGIRYGSAESVAFTERLSRELAVAGWQAALALAKEKGPAPIMTETFTVTSAMLERRPELAADGVRVGDRLPGRILHARYSRYMRRLAEVEPALVERLAEVGARFTHHSSVAPTGTLALSFGNNASNGIEPSFAHCYVRNVIRPERKTKEAVEVCSMELLAYRALVDPNAAPEKGLPEAFATADSVTPEEHVAVQAAAQRWIDSSISKTINVPSDCPFERFECIYRLAYRQGLKGCTTFRFNPQAFQGVLVRSADLAATRYRFTLADGTRVEARGDEQIRYDGEQHNAANLFEALKEGYYGRL